MLDRQIAKCEAWNAQLGILQLEKVGNFPSELCIISAAGVLKWSIEPTAVRVPCSWIRSLGNFSDKRTVI